MIRAIMKKENDNVATLLNTAEKNENVEILSSSNEVIDVIEPIMRIPFGNKIAVKEIEKDTDIKKNGLFIGTSIRKIQKGELVHVHNVKSERVNFPESIIKEILRRMEFEEEYENEV